ncbi:MAG: hypothetical protein COA90_01925 [Gammaproteobacteria bacterium]|nr:MAG: hypothetical protein COA90_01925 [Gammaproteobacteria bacterium]
MKLLGNLKISHKLFVIAALFVVSLIAMAATFTYIQLLSSGYSDILKKSESIKSSVETINSRVLEARQNEKDFLLKLNMSYIIEHSKELYSLDEELIRLDRLSSDDTKLNEIVKNVQVKLSAYNTLFQNVVQKKEKIGLNYKQGLLGDLRSSVRQVEEVLDEYSENVLTISMLKIRQHEKDFIRHEAQQYIVKLNQEYKQFKLLLKQSSLPLFSKNQINFLMNDYVYRFSVVSNETKDINKLIRLFQSAVDLIAPELIKLEQHVFQDRLIQENKLSSHIGKIELIYYGMTLFLILLTVPLLYLLSRNITQSMSRVSTTLEGFSTGKANITDRLEVVGHDEMTEIAIWFNQLMDKLQVMLKDVSDLASHLTETAKSSQTAKNETTEALHFQVNKIESIATSIESITSSIDLVAQDASDASSKANEADRAATSGNKEVEDVIVSIQKLAINVEQAVKSVQQIDDYSKNIDSIVAMINGIAEQTNLLALNAAIEAARAGDAGRGFAVVADEVRTLSKRTTSSTQEIKNTIIALQEGTGHAVRVMNESQQQATKSVEQAKQAGESINLITGSVASIATLNSNMSKAAAEQSMAAQKINTNIGEINQAANQLASSAQQNMSDSGDVSQTATLLLMMSKQFNSSDEEDTPSSGEGANTDEMDVDLF